MKKVINKIKIKLNKALLIKIMNLKKEIKITNKKVKDLTEVNHKLIDTITLKNIKIRELELGNRYERK